MPQLSGVLLVDKPIGLSSFAVLRKLKHVLKERYALPLKQVKIGHAGTLDPAAKGLLLVCLGHATKISSYLMRDDKVYVFDVLLGEATDTDDNEGDVIAKNDHVPTEEEVKKALLAFTGVQKQLPPNFSAIKHKGKKLYEYARKGVEIERTLREVRIDVIELLSYGYPVIKIKVACGKGTYMRALARDLGQALNSVAHAANICREKSGEFCLSQTVSLEALLNKENWKKEMLSLSQVLDFLPKVKNLSQDQKKDLALGRFLSSAGKDGEYVLQDEQSDVFALGERKNNELKVKRMLIDRMDE